MVTIEYIDFVLIVFDLVSILLQVVQVILLLVVPLLFGHGNAVM